MRKYNEVMEHIRVTEEMRERILGKIEEEELAVQAEEKHPVSFSRYQKYMPVAAALMVLVIAVVLIPKVTMKNLSPAQNSEQVQESSESNLEEIVSQSGGQEDLTESAELQGAAGYAGIAEAESAAALSEELGFPVADIRSVPFPITESTYSNYFGDMAEIEYSGEEDTLTYRKAGLTGEEAYDADISGVYENWTKEKQVTVQNSSVTLKGNEGSWAVAAWTADGFAFALYDRQGLTEEEMISIIKEIKETTGEKLTEYTGTAGEENVEEQNP